MENQPTQNMETSTSPSDALNARFARASLVVGNASKVQAIRTAMEGFGFGADELAEGQALLQETTRAFEASARESGEASAAVEARRRAEAAVESLSKVHLSVARLVFRGDQAAEKAMILRGRRDTSIGGWIRENLQFYNNLLANDSWVSLMERRGQSRASLEEARTRVAAVQSAWEAQKKEEGEAEAATPARDRLLADLEAWVSEYLAFAQIALADDPQQLEALGIVVPNE